MRPVLHTPQCGHGMTNSRLRIKAMRLLLTVVLLFWISIDLRAGAKPQQTLLQNSQSAAASPAYDRWWPVCLTVEQGAQPGLRDIQNALIQEALKCPAEKRVNIIVFARYVTNLPSTSAETVEAASKQCNIGDRPELGADRASAIVVTKRSGAGREMCKTKSPDIQGCAQFSRKPAESLKSRMEMAGAYGGVATAGRGAVSIIDATGSDRALSDAQMWGLGVSMMGLPFGPSAGFGVGAPDEGDGAAHRPNSPGWTAVGCDYLFQNAHTNKNKMRSPLNVQFDEAKAKPIDFMTARPLFGAKGGGNSVVGKSGSGNSGSARKSSQGENASGEDLAGGDGSPSKAQTVGDDSEWVGKKGAPRAGVTPRVPAPAEDRRRSTRKRTDIYENPGDGEDASGRHKRGQ